MRPRVLFQVGSESGEIELSSGKLSFSRSLKLSRASWVRGSHRAANGEASENNTYGEEEEGRREKGGEAAAIEREDARRGWGVRVVPGFAFLGLRDGGSRVCGGRAALGEDVM